MRIRTKIAIWTGAFALAVAICFSGFVFWEMREQPYRLIDRELRDLVETMAQTMREHADARFELEKEVLQHHYYHYWIRIEGEGGRLIFSTPMTANVSIPLRAGKVNYSFASNVAFSRLGIDDDSQDELDDLSNDKVVFRVMHDTILIEGRSYMFIIGKPIPMLIHEMEELRDEIVAGTVCCIVIACLAGFYLAGKILRPFSELNMLVREISENSLEKRIPVGKSRDELSILTASLNEMFDRLQYSFNRQKEFVGNAAHELKSPLTILMLGNEEMLSGPLPETVEKVLLRHQDILQRLSRLVRNLLEISRMEHRIAAKPEIFDLGEGIRHVLDDFNEVLLMRGITVETRFEVKKFGGDREKIQRMFINLLDNAIKYNLQNNGRIWIDTKKIQDIVRITVSNTGQKIPAEALPRIFDQFFRVEQSRSPVFGGSGLGLTIVKRIVQLHRGTIAVASSADGITQFTIELPQTDMSRHHSN